MKDRDYGVLYIAVGEKYLEEARYSASTVKENCSEIPIAVITDKETDDDVFDHVLEAEEADGFGTKVINMRHLPFERTLFLDTDIYVSQDISEIFDLLTNYSVVAVPKQDYYTRSGYEKDIPDCFPEYNTGVLGFNKTGAEELIERWIDEFEKNREDHCHDQPSFRSALYRTNISVINLGVEYNCAVELPGHVSRTVKIFHGRTGEHPFGSKAFEREMQEIENKLNSDTQRSRAFVYNDDEGLQVFEEDTKHPAYRYPSLPKRFFISLRKDGVVTTTKRTGKFIQRAFLD